jgi:hypothetical protein
MTYQDEDRLGEPMETAARTYHEPPEVPREAMWRAIGAERARRRAARRVVRRLAWSVAMAATLIIGIGIGRLVAPGGTGGPATAATGPSTAYRVATGQYLARAEVLLTALRAEGPSGGSGADFVSGARQLLATTRLLLDSPAAKDPRLASLLQDLELVLAQISQLADEPDRRAELEFIEQSITRSGVLTRLRATSPGAGLPPHTQGVL